MAERPVECSHCKKPVKVIYKEIVAKTITLSEMCADCPILQQKLHGEIYAKAEPTVETSLCCGKCLTTLESVKTGNPLGCSECYTVFADLITSLLIDAKSIPATLQKELRMKRPQTLHAGKAPGKLVTIAASSRLIALSEALNEALKRENYEQAAWLRDQIKALSEKPDEKKS